MVSHPVALVQTLPWLRCSRLWRYLRLIVNVTSFKTFKPIAPSPFPRYTSKDVTVIIPTLGTNEAFPRSLSSIVACSPYAIRVITPEKSVDRARKLCSNISQHIEVSASQVANKRFQMLQGVQHAVTPIVVFADDDVFWPQTFLPYILAPFEDPSTGAVGPYAVLERPTTPNVWDVLGAAYLERWNFEVGATSHMDGGIACLAGRSSALRTEIVQDPAFVDHFSHERWLGGIPLSKADDDNCLTRWLVNRGWKIKIQSAPEACIETTLENDSAFLGQCVRWCRTTWRSNITSLFVDRVIWQYVSSPSLLTSKSQPMKIRRLIVPCSLIVHNHGVPTLSI